MANEIKDWKKPECVLNLNINRFSQREIFSREINERYGEGGGLNANYRTVEAAMVVANILGLNGLKYGKDFIFKTSMLAEMTFDFANEKTKKKAEEILKEKKRKGE